MPHLTFLIPVRHPKDTREPEVARRILSETFASISAQDSGGWSAIVIANEGTDLPPLPPNFRVEWVNARPNPWFEQRQSYPEEFWNWKCRDKGGRLVVGLRAARDSDFVMLMDDDDYISRRISRFVKENPGEKRLVYKTWI